MANLADDIEAQRNTSQQLPTPVNVAAPRQTSTQQEDNSNGDFFDLEDKSAPSKFYARYLEFTRKYDEDIIRGWREGLDTLLIFAGLFSAVNTAIIIEALKGLTPDPAAQTNVLLERLITLQQSPESSVTMAISPPYSFAAPVAINCLLLGSLALSLFAALGAVLGKQWLYEYGRGSFNNSDKERAYERHRRFVGMQSWQFQRVVQSLPTVLQVSVLLFFFGLVPFVWRSSLIVGAVLLTVTMLPLALYIGLILVSAIDTTSPYQSPITHSIRPLCLSMYQRLRKISQLLPISLSIQSKSPQWRMDIHAMGAQDGDRSSDGSSSPERLCNDLELIEWTVIHSRDISVLGAAAGLCATRSFSEIDPAMRKQHIDSIKTPLLRALTSVPLQPIVDVDVYAVGRALIRFFEDSSHSREVSDTERWEFLDPEQLKIWGSSFPVGFDSEVKMRSRLLLRAMQLTSRPDPDRLRCFLQACLQYHHPPLWAYRFLFTVMCTASMKPALGILNQHRLCNVLIIALKRDFTGAQDVLDDFVLPLVSMFFRGQSPTSDWSPHSGHGFPLWCRDLPDLLQIIVNHTVDKRRPDAEKLMLAFLEILPSYWLHGGRVPPELPLIPLANIILNHGIKNDVLTDVAKAAALLVCDPKVYWGDRSQAWGFLKIVDACLKTIDIETRVALRLRCSVMLPRFPITLSKISVQAGDTKATVSAFRLISFLEASDLGETIDRPYNSPLKLLPSFIQSTEPECSEIFATYVCRKYLHHIDRLHHDAPNLQKLLSRNIIPVMRSTGEKSTAPSYHHATTILCHVAHVLSSKDATFITCKFGKALSEALRFAVYKHSPFHFAPIQNALCCLYDGTMSIPHIFDNILDEVIRAITTVIEKGLKKAGNIDDSAPPRGLATCIKIYRSSTSKVQDANSIGFQTLQRVAAAQGWNTDTLEPDIACVLHHRTHRETFGDVEQ